MDLSDLLGKWFRSPVTGEIYSIHEHAEGETPGGFDIDQHGSPVFWDDCGNLITMHQNGAIAFWDHETDKSHPISESIDELQRLARTLPLDSEEMPNANVVSAWVDPEFGKTIGLDVPNDGWIKKKDG